MALKGVTLSHESSPSMEKNFINAKTFHLQRNRWQVAGGRWQVAGGRWQVYNLKVSATTEQNRTEQHAVKNTWQINYQPVMRKHWQALILQSSVRVLAERLGQCRRLLAQRG